MGVRETINQSKGAKIAVAAVVLLTIGYLGFRAVRGSSAQKFENFFTTDDGATWFPDSAEKLAPFDHNGKQAVQCFVYKAGPSGKPWVSHLQRYTAEGLKQAKEKISGATGPTGPMMGFSAMQKATVEVKKPLTGDKGWVPITDPRAAAIIDVKPPDGSTAEVLPLDPNDF